jgi:DNA polymerase IIIc chi subunit
MSNKHVIFYIIPDSFLNVAIRLCEKLYASKEKALMLFDNDSDLREADSKLWTYSQLSFLPHGSKFSVSVDDAIYCSVWLSTNIEFINNPTCLIHNGLSNIGATSRNFEKIIDIFNVNQESFARERSSYYKTLGFDSEKIWRLDNNEWKSCEGFSN